MIIEDLQGWVEYIGQKIITEPDGDWPPHLVMTNIVEPKDKTGITEIYPGEFDKGMKNVIVALQMEIKDEFSRMQLAAGIHKLILEFKPDMACFISTVWMALAEDGEVQVAPSQNPDRKEAVILHCMGRVGEMDGTIVSFGTIERRPNKPPRIAKWEIMEDEAEFGGRISNAMRHAFNELDNNS